jgi:uncharacterized protein (DUF305 family)
MRPIGAACMVATLASSALWTASCGGRGHSGSSTVTASATAPDTDGVALAASNPPLAAAPATNGDVELVTGMVDHQLMAVLIGESCLEKAVHDELRSLCESLVAAEGGQVQALQSRQKRYFVVREPEMASGMDRQMDRLSALRGPEFEVELLQAMLRHDREGVTEGRACVARAHDPQLIRLCQEIARTQLAAATHEQTWLCSWYGRC